MKIYKEANLKSKIIGKIPSNKKLTAKDGKVEINPGIAYKIKELPLIGYTEDETIEFQYKKPIYILHYIGEGYTKVYHNVKYNYLSSSPSNDSIYKLNK